MKHIFKYSVKPLNKVQGIRESFITDLFFPDLSFQALSDFYLLSRKKMLNSENKNQDFV